MKNRTLIRTTLDIFFNNSIAKSIKYFVNFCYEQRLYNSHELKFLKNLPISNIDITPRENNFLFKINR